MNLNLQISFWVSRGDIFSCGGLMFLKNHLCTAGDYGVGRRGKVKVLVRLTKQTP